MNSKPKLYIACILVAFLLLHKFIGSAFENSETEIIEAPEYTPESKKRFVVNTDEYFNSAPSRYACQEWTHDTNLKDKSSDIESTYQISPIDGPEVVLFCKSSAHGNDPGATKCKQVKSAWHRLLKGTDTNTHGDDTDHVCMHDDVRISYKDMPSPEHGIRFVPSIVYFHQGRLNNAHLENVDQHEMAIYEGDNEIAKWKAWITKMSTSQPDRVAAIQRTKEVYGVIYPLQ